MTLGDLIFYLFWGLVIIGLLIVLFRKMFSSEENSSSEIGITPKNDSTRSNDETKQTLAEVEIEKAQSVEPIKESISETATNCCIHCGNDLGIQWHYDFESIEMANRVGAQCQNCGLFLCRTDLKYGADGEYEPCSKCNGSVVRLEEGSAQSSMVDKARRERRYHGAIKEPLHLGRPILTD